MRNNINPDKSVGNTGGADGVLYRLDPDGSISEWKSNLGVSNTVAWSPDRTRSTLATAWPIPSAAMTTTQSMEASVGNGHFWKAFRVAFQTARPWMPRGICGIADTMAAASCVSRPTEASTWSLKCRFQM